MTHEQHKKQTWKDGQQKGPKVTGHRNRPPCAPGRAQQGAVEARPPASCLQDAAALVRVTWHRLTPFASGSRRGRANLIFFINTAKHQAMPSAGRGDPGPGGAEKQPS